MRVDSNWYDWLHEIGAFILFTRASLVYIRIARESLPLQIKTNAREKILQKVTYRRSLFGESGAIISVHVWTKKEHLRKGEKTSGTMVRFQSGRIITLLLRETHFSVPRKKIQPFETGD